MVYYGGGKPDNMTMEEVMADWGKWYEELGSAIVDGGNPFDDGAQAVSNKGVEAAENPAGGYTIVNAEDMNAAVEMAKGNPMHTHNPDTAVVHVYEAMPM